MQNFPRLLPAPSIRCNSQMHGWRWVNLFIRPRSVDSPLILFASSFVWYVCTARTGKSFQLAATSGELQFIGRSVDQSCNQTVFYSLWRHVMMIVITISIIAASPRQLCTNRYKKTTRCSEAIRKRHHVVRNQSTIINYLFFIIISSLFAMVIYLYSLSTFMMIGEGGVNKSSIQFFVIKNFFFQVLMVWKLLLIRN